MPITGFLFSGPGSASVQMGRDLYNKVLSVRNSMDRADKVFASEGFKVTKACFLGTDEDLAKPSIAAPALLAICHGLMDALKSKRIYPQMVTGYGWGEVAALACAGTLPFEEALKFLRKRGEILEQAWAAQPFHVASVVGLSAEALAEKFKPLPKKPEIIMEDSPDAVVVAGEEGLLKKILPLLASKTVKVGPLLPGISWPHASLAEAGQRVGDEFSKLRCEKAGSWDYYSSLGGVRVTDFRELSKLQAGLCSQFLSFKACATAMRAGGMDTVIEIGVGQSLGGFVRKLDSGIRALASEDTKLFSSALKLAP